MGKHQATTTKSMVHIWGTHQQTKNGLHLGNNKTQQQHNGSHLVNAPKTQNQWITFRKYQAQTTKVSYWRKTVSYSHVTLTNPRPQHNNTIQYNTLTITIQYNNNTTQYNNNTIQYNAITIQYNNNTITIQYNTITIQ